MVALEGNKDQDDELNGVVQRQTKKHRDDDLETE
jgi:hypothetical protein